MGVPFLLFVRGTLFCILFGKMTHFLKNVFLFLPFNGKMESGYDFIAEVSRSLGDGTALNTVYEEAIYGRNNSNRERRRIC